MKKHELLKHAYDNYPKGTKFKQMASGKSITSSGSFDFNIYETWFCIYDSKEKDFVYISTRGQWAEIITEQPKKIAVQVNNEKEFKALMKYYDSLGYVWNGGDKPLAKQELHRYPNAIKFEDRFQHSTGRECPDYTIIPFPDFAKEHNIKLPLLTSEDGVDLYEGDEYFRVGRSGASADKDWKLFTPDRLQCCHFVCAYPETDKAFSTKEAALKWIEEEKPKSKEVKLFNGGTANVYREYIMVRGGIKITPSDMKNISHALKELS